MAPRRSSRPWAYQPPTSMEPDIADGFMPQMPGYGPPMASPAMMPMDAGGDPYEAQILAQLAGLEAPQMESGPEPQFNPGGFGGFLEGLSGLENQRGPARTFGEGLVGGFSRGLGSAGTRVASQRQKFEESATQRQAVRDQQHQQATRDYKAERQRLFGDLGKLRGEERKAKREEAGKTRLTQEMIDAAPPGSPIKRQRVGTLLEDASRISALTAPPTANKPEKTKLVEVTNPDGSKSLVQERAGLVTAPKAGAGGGKPPTEFQAKAQLYGTAAREADALAADGGLEDRVLNKAWSLQAPPALQSDPDVRSYWRAMESFTLALNRLESGANVTPTEFGRVRQLFFVAPGDKEADKIAKGELRRQKIATLEGLQAPGTTQATPEAETAAPAVPDTWKRVR